MWFDAITEQLPGLAGASPAMREFARVVRRAAGSDANLLLVGETGTGKTLTAHVLHTLGPRSNEPFVAVACRSLAAEQLFGVPEGKVDEKRPGAFERAGRGTIFLDEVSELRLAVQAELVRALEELRVPRSAALPDRSIEARVIATTHRDLDLMAREGSFRADLLYRLRVASIAVPPLRERAGDAPLLAVATLEALVASGVVKRPLGLAPETLAVLERYAWPGNVRELRAAIERAALVATSEQIEPTDLPSEVRDGGPNGEHELATMTYQRALETAREGVTRRYVEAVLRRTAGNVAQAAEIAGIERESFYRLLRRYGISPFDFRGND